MGRRTEIVSLRHAYNTPGWRMIQYFFRTAREERNLWSVIFHFPLRISINISCISTIFFVCWHIIILALCHMKYTHEIIFCLVPNKQIVMMHPRPTFFFFFFKSSGGEVGEARSVSRGRLWRTLQVMRSRLKWILGGGRGGTGAWRECGRCGHGSESWSVWCAWVSQRYFNLHKTVDCKTT